MLLILLVLVLLILLLVLVPLAALAALLAMLAVRERGADAESRERRCESDVAKCFHLDLLWLTQGKPAVAI